jgi:thiol-disulfide isomerase/thioredoxin
LLAVVVLATAMVTQMRAAPGKTPAPELDGVTLWLNSEPLQLSDLRGRVVLLQFFEYNCVNCLRTLPYLQAWRERYEKDGLVVIGIHTPQYLFSLETNNVVAALKRLGISYPVAVDNEFNLWAAFSNKYWPRLFLLDKDGAIRYDRIGEGGYEETEATIQQLLRETGAKAFPPLLEPVRPEDRAGAVCYPHTREVHLGYARGRLGNYEGMPSGHIMRYRTPKFEKEGVVYASGEWEVGRQFLRHARNTRDFEDFIGVLYRGAEANVILRPSGRRVVRVFVQQDGEWLTPENAGADVQFTENGESMVEVAEARVYHVVQNPDYGTYELRIYAKEDGVAAYAFAFGTCEVASPKTLGASAR